MFLSLRTALERWPRQLRFFVLTLALLTWVAPTWHVCELGGHVMSSCASNAPSHHQVFQQVEVSSDTAQPRPLICYCPPHAREAKYPELPGPVLTAMPGHSSHPTCLALLLQAMPGVVAHTPDFSEVFVSRPIRFETRAFAYSRRHFQTIRGRAPPVEL